MNDAAQSVATDTWDWAKALLLTDNNGYLILAALVGLVAAIAANNVLIRYRHLFADLGWGVLVFDGKLWKLKIRLTSSVTCSLVTLLLTLFWTDFALGTRIVNGLIVGGIAGSLSPEINDYLLRKFLPKLMDKAEGKIRGDK